MSEKTVREGYIRNATLAQLYRWYQLYENNDIPIRNSLDILEADISIKSGLGEAIGHDSYTQGVGQLPKTWKNSHNVKTADIVINDDGLIEMAVNIIYQNQGMLPEGAVRTADLTYTTTLSETDKVLPQFNSIEIKQNSEGRTDNFTPLYVQNRVKSALHYWLAIIEDPRRDPEPAREILSEDFALNFSSGKIDTFDGFKKWLAGPGSSIDASTHLVTTFKAETISENLFKMQADFEWAGIQAEGTELVAKTRHNWILTDDPKERFARIKQIDVEVIIPFQPKQK